LQPISIFSLTELGQKLAHRISVLIPHAECIHRPEEFKATVLDRFVNKHRLIMICAAGIVMRVLAPALKNKQDDPAVLVIDQGGRYVIPLLSGHEGGGNLWGREVADKLNAQCVITSAANYYDSIRVAGIGCSRGCCAEDILQVMEQAMDSQALDLSCLQALASIELKSDEQGLLEVGQRLGLPLHFYSAEILAEYEARLTQKSEIVYRETGCYGIAEAAALVHCERLSGGRANLEIAKHKNRVATFALARSFAELSKH